MNVRRREALGRNRRGPATTNTMGTVAFLCVVVVGLAVFAYQYLTQPERVFGNRELKCSVFEIEWETGESSTLIRGCDRQIEARCGERHCFPMDPF